MSDAIGEFLCPRCGLQQVHSTEGITIFYPKGVRAPRAKVLCHECGMESICELQWKDAMVFDFKGAKVAGFSFSRGPKITEEEIDTFVEDFESEIEGFLNATDRKE